MAREIYRFRYKCVTTNSIVYEWSEYTPTQCQHDPAHEISDSSMSIVETITEDIVKAEVLEEKYGETGGHFQASSLPMTCSGVGWHERDISWPFPINMLSAQIFIDDDNVGDRIETIGGGSGITVGTVNEPIVSGSNYLVLSGLPLDYSEPGHYVRLSQGENTYDLGYILSKDSESSKVYMAEEIVVDLTPAPESPIIFKKYVKLIKEMNLSAKSYGPMVIGSTKVGASYLPPNVPLRMRYYNSNGNDKTLMVILEYLY